MRVRHNVNGISVHGISGTHVVLLGMDADEESRKGLLGFAIQREDHIEDEKYWLSGFKTFEGIETNRVPGVLHSTLKHPVQTFLWGDYSAKPEYKYTYTVRPVYGSPDDLQYGQDVSITIHTEAEDEGEHAVFFNRGAIASQHYARKFENKPPDPNFIEDPKTKWLSRGLLEAALRFIGSAKNAGYGLKVAAYELDYEPVLKAFKEASERGAHVEIVYEAGPKSQSSSVLTSTSLNNEKAIDGIRDICYKRTKRPAIAHNKFMVLEKDGEPIEVWTGSTNFTPSGFLGQTNVGHIVRNKEVAQKFKEYWQKLKEDTGSKEIKQWNHTHTPTPDGDLTQGDTLYFCPRKYSKMLSWYAGQIRKSSQSLMFTAAFGVDKNILGPAIAEDKEFLRFLLIEKKLSDAVESMIQDEREIIVARGQTLGNNAIRYRTPGWELDRWFVKEEHYRKQGHVFYVHTKFMLLDSLSDDPLTFSGSANFSYNSVMRNDENMLLIRGNKRVADIYLGEFMRLFSHFYFRSIVNKLASKGRLNSNLSAYLKNDDSWTEKYFTEGSYGCLRRELFR